MQDHPFSREAPADVVRRLRAIDPTLRVIYWGEGRWRVGRMRPTPERRQAGADMLADLFQAGADGRVSDERCWYRNLRWSHLIGAGFAPLHEFAVSNEVAFGVLEATVRRAIYLDRHASANDGLRAIEATDKNPRAAAQAALGDPYLAREASRLLRAPVSITSPGMPHAA